MANQHAAFEVRRDAGQVAGEGDGRDCGRPELIEGTEVLSRLSVSAELQFIVALAGGDGFLLILAGVEQDRLGYASSAGDREWRERRLGPALVVGDVFLGEEVARGGEVAGE